MGWTTYNATHYKNGKVDKKAECCSLFTDNNFSVLKCAMVGNVWYGAIKHDDLVFGMVILTSVKMKDYFNFGYKDMEETMGPCYYDCPKSIIDLLTPTDNKNAIEWRNECLKNASKEKNALNKLPLGSVIEFVMPFDTQYHKKGRLVTLEKKNVYGMKNACWCDYNCKFTRNLMLNIIEHTEYKVVRIGE